MELTHVTDALLSPATLKEARESLEREMVEGPEANVGKISAASTELGIIVLTWSTTQPKATS